eukprot:gb/GEZN01000086.1/.p1 GENE.gb/GEZN01000086.1/~~gb/GEZN01000086.1/.p1  ORF type:complete len:2177 (-),score=115.46 gb/GEZN01000086.1/:918-7289(-)
MGGPTPASPGIGESFCMTVSVQVAQTAASPQYFRPFVDLVLPPQVNVGAATVTQGSIILQSPSEWAIVAPLGADSPAIPPMLCNCNNSDGVVYGATCLATNPYMYKDPEQCTTDLGGNKIPLEDNGHLISVQTLASQLARGGPPVTIQICGLSMNVDVFSFNISARGGFLLGTTLASTCNSVPSDPLQLGVVNADVTKWDQIFFKKTPFNLAASASNDNGGSGLGWDGGQTVSIAVAGAAGIQVGGCSTLLIPTDAGFTGVLKIDGRAVCLCSPPTARCGYGNTSALDVVAGTFGLGCGALSGNCAACAGGVCPATSPTLGPCNDPCNCEELSVVCPECSIAARPPTFNFAGPCALASDTPPCDGAVPGMTKGNLTICFGPSFNRTFDVGIIGFINNGTDIIAPVFQPRMFDYDVLVNNAYYQTSNGTRFAIAFQSATASASGALLKIDKQSYLGGDNDNSGGFSPGDDVLWLINLTVAGGLNFLDFAFMDQVQDPLSLLFDSFALTGRFVNTTAIHQCTFANIFDYSFFTYNNSDRFTNCSGTPGEEKFGLNLTQLVQNCTGVNFASFVGPMEITVTYKTRINTFWNQKCNEVVPYGSPDPVNIGDCLCNNVQLEGVSQLDTGGTEAVPSPTDSPLVEANRCESIQSAVPKLSIYAYNGMACGNDTTSMGCNGVFFAGDVVTFRSFRAMPLTMFHDMSFKLTAPLPIFTTGGFGNTFNMTFPPPLFINQIQYGPLANTTFTITQNCTDCPDETGTWLAVWADALTPFRSSDPFYADLLATYMVTNRAMQNKLRVSAQLQTVVNVNKKCSPDVNTQLVVQILSPQGCIITTRVTAIENPYSKNLVPPAGMNQHPTLPPAPAADEFRYIQEADLVFLMSCVKNGGSASMYDIRLELAKATTSLFYTTLVINTMQLFYINASTGANTTLSFNFSTGVNGTSVFFDVLADGSDIRVYPGDTLCVQYGFLVDKRFPASPTGTKLEQYSSALLEYNAVSGGQNYVGNLVVDNACLRGAIFYASGVEPNIEQTITKNVADPTDCALMDVSATNLRVMFGEPLYIETCAYFPEQTTYNATIDFLRTGGTNALKDSVVLVSGPTLVSTGQSLSGVVIGTFMPSSAPRRNDWGTITLGDVYSNYSLINASDAKSIAICFSHTVRFDLNSNPTYTNVAVAQEKGQISYKPLVGSSAVTRLSSNVQYAPIIIKPVINVRADPNASVEISPKVNRTVCYDMTRTQGTSGTYVQACEFNVMTSFVIPAQFDTVFPDSFVIMDPMSLAVSPTYVYDSTTRTATYMADFFKKAANSTPVSICFTGQINQATTSVPVTVNGTFKFDTTQNITADFSKNTLPAVTASVTFITNLLVAKTTLTSFSACNTPPNAKQMTVCETLLFSAEVVLPIANTKALEVQLRTSNEGIITVFNASWRVKNNSIPCLYNGTCPLSSASIPTNGNTEIGLLMDQYDQGNFAKYSAFYGDVCVPPDVDPTIVDCRTLVFTVFFTSGGSFSKLQTIVPNQISNVSNSADFLVVAFNGSEASFPRTTIPTLSEVYSYGVSVVPLVNRLPVYRMYLQQPCVAGVANTLCLNRTNTGASCLEGNATFGLFSQYVPQGLTKFNQSDPIFYFPNEVLVGMSDVVCIPVYECVPLDVCFMERHVGCLEDLDVNDTACILVASPECDSTGAQMTLTGLNVLTNEALPSQVVVVSYKNGITGVSVVPGTTVPASNGGTVLINADGSYVFNPLGIVFTPGQPFHTTVVYKICQTDPPMVYCSETELVIKVMYATDDCDETDRHSNITTKNVLDNDSSSTPPDYLCVVNYTSLMGGTVGPGVLVMGDRGGTFVIYDDGSYVFSPLSIPIENFPTDGSYFLTSINYTACKKLNATGSITTICDSAKLTVKILYARDNCVATDANTPITNQNVLGNDSPSTPDVLVVVNYSDQMGGVVLPGTVVMASNGGTVVLYENGSYVFDPAGIKFPTDGSSFNTSLFYKTCREPTPVCGYNITSNRDCGSSNAWLKINGSDCLSTSGNNIQLCQQLCDVTASCVAFGVFMAGEVGSDCQPGGISVGGIGTGSCIFFSSIAASTTGTTSDCHIKSMCRRRMRRSRADHQGFVRHERLPGHGPEYAHRGQERA